MGFIKTVGVVRIIIDSVGIIIDTVGFAGIIIDTVGLIIDSAGLITDTVGVSYGETQNNNKEIAVCRGGEPEGSHEDAHKLATPAGVPTVQPVLLPAGRHHRASQDTFCHTGGMEGGTGLLQLRCTIAYC